MYESKEDEIKKKYTETLHFDDLNDRFGIRWANKTEWTSKTIYPLCNREWKWMTMTTTLDRPTHSVTKHIIHLHGWARHDVNINAFLVNWILGERKKNISEKRKAKLRYYNINIFYYVQRRKSTLQIDNRIKSIHLNWEICVAKLRVPLKKRNNSSNNNKTVTYLCLPINHHQLGNSPKKEKETNQKQNIIEDKESSNNNRSKKKI